VKRENADIAKCIDITFVERSYLRGGSKVRGQDLNVLTIPPG
jgi:hypothetical protein